jgi:hypothetical protein
MPVDTTGRTFEFFRSTQPDYSPATQEASRDTVERLLQNTTANDHPGMLLGQVQSGKTRAFMGAIALAFDNSFDVAVIFTKGTRALTRQTLARVRRDLRPAIEREMVAAHDVKVLPDNLTDWDLEQKLVIVCKKEDDNLRRLTTALTVTYPALAAKRLLIIDDEADFASVGYRRRQGTVQANVIPTQIEGLRRALANAAFLQVTATPYSLYLQPEVIQLPAQPVFSPVRPAFTVTVPVHAGYVGGSYYFEASRVEGSVPSFLHVPFDPAELGTMGHPGSIDLANTNLLTIPDLAAIRAALVTFVVGAGIRRWQQEQDGQPPEHYSFIVHTHTKRAVHNWQAEIVQALVEQLQAGVETQPGAVRDLIQRAFEDLQRSVQAADLGGPTVNEVVTTLMHSLRAIMVTTVNSERDIDQLLDDNGELSRRNPFNIFIGGQILDRGVTIERLIGFYYGRNPKRAQQDTVLQHSRMYGNRPPADLAVTRFYTTPHIYDVMRRIHEYDSALRAAIEASGPDHSVVFLRTDPGGRLIPCSPNKILMSDVVALHGGSSLLPVGFATTNEAPRVVPLIDQLLEPHPVSTPFALPLAESLRLIDLIAQSVHFDPGYEFDFDDVKAAIQHLDHENPDITARGSVHVVIQRDRNASKRRPNGRLQNYPLGQRDEDLLDRGAGSRPRLLLLREQGRREQGWSDAPFWWPVLFAPPNARPVIFAKRLTDGA